MRCQKRPNSANNQQLELTGIADVGGRVCGVCSAMAHTADEIHRNNIHTLRH